MKDYSQYLWFERLPNQNATPKISPKKNESVTAIKNALIIDDKNAWLGHQVALCVNKLNKNSICGCCCC